MEPDASLVLLQRGHALYGPECVGGGELGENVGDLRALADRLISAPVTGVSAGRLPVAVQRLRALADDDEALRRLLGELAASHRQGRSATGVVLDAARSDAVPAGDTPLGRREFYRRMAGRLRDQHGHISRSRGHARELRAALRRHSYRGRRGRRLVPLGGLTLDSSPREVAAAIIREARRRGYSPAQTIAILSTAMQESGLRPRAVGGGGAWKDVFQQDTSYPGRDDPNVAISEFFNRLDAKGGPASHNIWKSIFWLQQRPGDVSAEAAFSHGRQAYLTEIQSQVGRAERLYHELTNPAGKNV
jgi:hypothetical protein